MAISCCSECTKLFEESMDGDMPPICPACYNHKHHCQSAAEESRQVCNDSQENK